MDKKTQIMVVTGTVVLVAILLSIAVWSSKRGTTTEEVATSTATTTTLTQAEVAGTTGLPLASAIAKNETAGLAAADQVTGEFVAVTNLNITSDTWVTVYDSVNGQPGRVMGAWLERVESATPKTIVPLLSRKTEAGKTYFVALIRDDGDREFDLSKDRPSADAPVVSFVAK
ncbi:MAG TPA: hypothetical protein VJ579_00515 [Candidatus Paceibacterota bacterium]|nr:hypothetical protein [Candidatus Paceibacterota bacterium]